MIDEQMVAGPAEGRPAEDGPGWGWRDVGLTLALTIGAALGLSLITRSLVASLGLQLENALVSPALYMVGVGVYLAAVAGVYLFAARRAGWAALGLREASWVNYALVPALFIVELFALLAVNSLVAWLAGGFENPQVNSITGGRAMAPAELAMLLLLVAGLVPFAEELFFRGMLYPLLRRRAGAAVAITLNAAIFALAHFIPLLLPGLFVVGLFLAYMRERSGSIWPSVFLHALQNSIALLSINAALSSGAL